MRLTLFITCLLLNLVVHGGCSPFKPDDRDMTPSDLPQQFALYTGETDPKRQRWWLDFGSTELTRLIESGLSDNLSLQEIWARLAQTRAMAAKIGASRYPDFTATADAGVTSSQKEIRNFAGKEAFSLGLLVSSYELDLWGRLQAKRQAAELDVVATREDLHTAAISLAAEVALRWLGIIASRLQQQLLEKQLCTNKTILELVEFRFKNAMVSALDVYQQKTIGGPCQG